MKTIRQTWKQPFTALALLASLHTTTATAQATPPNEPQPGTLTLTAPATPTAPEAPQPAISAVAPRPAIAAVPRVAVAVETTPVPVVSAQPAVEINSSFSSGGFPGKASTPTEAQRILRDKLENIVIDKAEYDGLPLSEVVSQLVEIAAKYDSAGVNFILNRERPDNAGGAVDPATGLPVAGPSSMDWSTVTVTIKPGLRHIRFIDFLEVLVKSTDQPIKYSVENYGVVFSQDPTKATINAPVAANGWQQPMEVKTFKLGTNAALTELIQKSGFRSSDKSTEVKGVLIGFLRDFGQDEKALEKSLYYNSHSGILMVRASKPDMEVISAAMETLLGNGNVANADPRGVQHQVGQ